MNLNRAMIIGNLTRDPELRTTPNGQNVATFGVATNHTWTDASGQRQEKAEFHNVVAWGKLAEICGQYLGKGRKVYIEGRLQTREWESQDGTKRNRTEIVTENMIMLDRAGAGPAPAMATQAASVQPAAASSGGEEEIRVEDIPF
ncbi:MAG: single-stranded DNA-binding protein [bacterium]